MSMRRKGEQLVTRAKLGKGKGNYTVAVFRHHDGGTSLHQRIRYDALAPLHHQPFHRSTRKRSK